MRLTYTTDREINQPSEPIFLLVCFHVLERLGEKQTTKIKPYHSNATVQTLTGPNKLLVAQLCEKAIAVLEVWQMAHYLGIQLP